MKGIMRVKFIRDFRGRETGEVFYKAGSVVKLDDKIAQDLCKRGIVQLLKDEPESAPAIDRVIPAKKRQAKK
jgi:hypothetical protein